VQSKNFSFFPFQERMPRGKKEFVKKKNAHRQCSLKVSVNDDAREESFFFFVLLYLFFVFTTD